MSGVIFNNNNYRDFIGILSGFHRDFIGISSGFYRDFIGILSGFYRDFIGILSDFFVCYPLLGEPFSGVNLYLGLKFGDQFEFRALVESRLDQYFMYPWGGER